MCKHTLYKHTMLKGVPVIVQAYALQAYKVERRTGNCKAYALQAYKVEGRTGNCKAYVLQAYKVERRTGKCADIRFTSILRWKG